jgi:hypothetical protein
VTTLDSAIACPYSLSVNYKKLHCENLPKMLNFFFGMIEIKFFIADISLIFEKKYEFTLIP